MAIYTRDYARYAWQLLNGLRARGELEIAARRDRDIEPYIAASGTLRLLDLANGRLQPQYTILKGMGHNVYGIDRVNRNSFGLTDIAYSFARKLYAWRINTTQNCNGLSMLVCGDVDTLPFKTNSFHLATSVAAFEHFMNVPRVVAELSRVICPGGLAWVAIHPFACLSGGHNLSLTEFPLQAVPKGIDPWDHLRKRHLPFRVPLNEWRLDQYRAEFCKHFQILKQYCATREGEELLTPKIETELSDYSRDELTCNAYVIVARKSHLQQPETAQSLKFPVSGK